jgi:hypothetical protein
VEEDLIPTSIMMDRKEGRLGGPSAIAVRQPRLLAAGIAALSRIGSPPKIV